VSATTGDGGGDLAPVRRRLFAVWALWVWLAWLFSRELLDCRHLPAVVFHLCTPPWPSAGTALRSAALALAGAGVTALAGLGCGRALLGLCSPAAGRWLALAAGLPLLALAAQGAGWLGLADPRVFAALAAVAAAAALPCLGRPLAALRHPGTDGWLVWIPRAAVAGVLVAAFAPEVAWDAVVYHLRVPSLYLVSRKIVPLPAIFPSYFPFTGETLFLVARSLGGDPAARVLHALAWVAAAEGVARLAARVWSRDAAPWARAMFLTLPFGMVIASRAYVEFFLVLFLVGSLLALTGPRPRWLAAGWLAGAAFGTKYLGGAAAVVLLAVAVHRTPGGRLGPRGRFGPGVRGPLLFAAAAVAAGGVWLIRTWAWTGNPVYPVLFGGLRWTPADMAGWRDDARALHPDPAVLLAAPWRLMTEPGSDGALSPLVLTAVAGPLLWPAARRGRLWGVALALFLVWWLTATLARYLTPALAIACVAGAGCVNGMAAGPVARRWMTRLSIAGLVGSVACGVKAIQFSTASYEPALGKVTAAGYRAGYFRPEGYDAVLAALERRTPASGRAYLMGHVFSYDLPRRVWFEFLYVRPPLYWWLKDADSAERVRIAARQAALTQIAWHPLGGLAILGKKPWLIDWTPGRLRAYRGFWAMHVREAERIGDWVIFDVRPGSGTPDPAARGGRPWTGRTLPGTEGITGPADRAWQAGRRADAARLARAALARFPDFPDARRRAHEYGAAR
jgi:hypothetical protein